MEEYIRPDRTAGLRHLALNVINFESSVDFYTRLLGMEVEWQPDADNFYLTSGNDNLALHRVDSNDEIVKERRGAQSLDHLGFIIDTKEDVFSWFDFLKQENVEMLSEVKDHRDGARSFYCRDPDGNAVQVIYHPPLSSDI